MKASLSYTILSSYLLWMFFGTIGISLIPRCYGNSVLMATRLKNNFFVLSHIEFIFGIQVS